MTRMTGTLHENVLIIFDNTSLISFFEWEIFERIFVEKIENKGRNIMQ